MKLLTKINLLKTAKQHLKNYPNGSIEIDYQTMDPQTGVISCKLFNYKSFKFELNYAIKNNIHIKAIKFNIKEN